MTVNRLERAYTGLATRLGQWSTKRFLLTVIVIQILLHIPILPLPPMGQHTWRQVMGLATSRNYYEEGNSFLEPSQDIRIGKADRGIIFFEFPLLSWIVGQSYHITGFSHVNGRLMMLLMGILLILGGYGFMRSLGYDEIRARWFVFFLSFSPYFFYYSVSVSPNLPALTWFICGIALFLPGLKRDSYDWRFWLGVCLVSLAIMSKATYWFFGLPLAFLFLNEYHKKREARIVIVTLVSLLVIVIPNLLMFVHAKQIFNQAPLERQVHAVLTPHFFPHSLADVKNTLRPAIVEWFLQMYVNTVAIPFFLYGCYVAVREKSWKSENGRFMITWLVSFLIFFSLFFTQFREHAYYQTPNLIIAAFASSLGIERWVQSRRFRFILVLLLVLVPVVMVGRVGHRWLWAKQVPDELLYHADRFQEVIPQNEQVLVFGDRSPVVFLYYLHRKGVVVSPDVTDETIERYRAHGIRYIVSDVPIPDIPALDKLQLTVVRKIGDFFVLRIDR